MVYPKPKKDKNATVKTTPRSNGGSKPKISPKPKK